MQMMVEKERERESGKKNIAAKCADNFMEYKRQLIVLFVVEMRMNENERNSSFMNHS